MITLYNVISEDGYIAREDGSEDFIVEEIWSTTLELIRQYDVLVLGRKTYEAIQAYHEKLLIPFEALPVRKVVVSRNILLTLKDGFELMNNTDAIPLLGQSILVSSGPSLNNYLIERKMVDRVILHNVHVPIGQGMPPFDEIHLAKMKLLASNDLGLVEESTFSLVDHGTSV